MMPLPKPQQPAPPASPADPTPAVVVPPAELAAASAPLEPKRRLPRRAVIVSATAVLLLGISGFGYKIFAFDPQHAPDAYLHKLLTAKTGSFKAAANFSSAEDKGSIIGGDATFTANGRYDLTNPKTPKSDVTLGLKYDEGTFAAELITIPKKLYVKIDQLGFLHALGVTLSKDWYTLPLDEETKDSCTAKERTRSGSFFGIAVPNSLPLKHTRRVGLWEKVDGHSTTHYKGEVDFTKLPAMIDAANKELSADCKLSIDKESLKNVSLSYDIWRGKNFDRVTMKVQDTQAKSATTVTLDTSDYNQPAMIQEPKNAKPLQSIFDAFNQSSASDTNLQVDSALQ